MPSPYARLSESDLLELQASATAMLKKVMSGVVFETTTVNGKSFTRRLPSIDQLEDQLGKIQDALQDINPDDYGRRITRTVPRFV